MGVLDERRAMEKPDYLLTTDSYLKRVTAMLDADDREGIEHLVYEEKFVEIAWTPYFIEQLFCLVQLEYPKVTINIIEGFRSVYGRRTELFGNDSFSQKQWIIILKQLEKYLSSGEENYHYFLLKNEAEAEKSRMWKMGVLYNHERVEMFQTELFQTLDHYSMHFPKGYEAFIELTKHSELSRYRLDGTMTAWIYNTLLIVNHFGFVLDKLDAQQIYDVLQLYDVTEDDFFSRRNLPELLKKAQKKTLWKKWRLWSWKRRLSLASR
ncbi:hypothetical protein [uncultured Enterococcus sp.]|uniref:hypothetical protein n=1 Tax=uncultured Enterococcus sp. TaxID=167972 RepID=UPI002AA767EB|nr:hypothetical protein [uncultured Enterococcus sp.]